MVCAQKRKQPLDAHFGIERADFPSNVRIQIELFSKTSYEWIDGEHLRVATTMPRNAHPVPLLIFNGIGASLDILGPFMRRVTRYRTITFDLPGVGGSDASWMFRRVAGYA